MPLLQLQLPESSAAYAETPLVPVTARRLASTQTADSEAVTETGEAMQQAQQQIAWLQAEARRLRNLLQQLQAENCDREAQLRAQMLHERELRRQLCLLTARPAGRKTAIVSLTKRRAKT